MRRLAAFVLAGLAVAAPARAADVMTLPRDVVFGPSARASQAADVPFHLPAGARQGPRTWYLVRLHLRVAVSPRSGDGRLYVLGYTNGKACAQIRFDTRRTASGLRVHSSELGLVSGARERTSASLVHELTFRNFLLLSGVRGGGNVLTIEVAQHGQARFASVRVLAGSGIERSPYEPASIMLEPFLDSESVEAGKSFRVRFRVRNPGGRAAANGVVRAEPGPGLVVLSRKSVRFATVPPHGSVGGEFTLEAQATGRHELQLAAASVSGSPVARLAITVEEASRPEWQWTALATAVLAAALAAAAFLLRGLARRIAFAAAGSALYVAAVVFYTYAASVTAAFAILVAASLVAGFAVGSWWAAALPFVFPLVALTGGDDPEAQGWLVALFLTPLAALPVAAGATVRKSLGRTAH